MSKFVRSLALTLAIAFAFISATLTSVYAEKKVGDTWSFNYDWSIYAGWNPLAYAEKSGILKKWADKKGIIIKLNRRDYMSSVTAFVTKQNDACVMTNMEALDNPAAAGISSTSIITGDFSNGNDCGMSRDNLSIEQWKGKEVFLVQFSVSDFLLSRALEKHGMKESDVIIRNVSDEKQLVASFIATPSQKCIVTWNPMVMQIAQLPGITKTFCSSEFPGEILDLTMVNTNVLNAHPEFGEALVGAWYEVMAIMSKRGATTDKAMEIMAKAGSNTLIEYKNQLKTTAMFYDPTEAANYTKGEEIKTNMDHVRNFCFKSKLLGENVKSADKVGIQYPDGTIQGDKSNVKLIFDASYMQKAADVQ